MAKWSGQERRKDMPDIVSRLVKLETLQEADINEATAWRKLFCDKMDKIMANINENQVAVISLDKTTSLLINNLHDKIIEKINHLPCDLREGRWASLIAQTKWLWIAIGFIMTILTGITFVLIVRLVK